MRQRALAQYTVLVLALLFLGSLGCAAPGPPRYPVRAPDVPKQLYVVRHAWHTGIVVKTDDVNPHLWPETSDFPEALYLAVGWGDRDFYQAVQAGLGLLLQAALNSPASVLFVIGVPTPLPAYFPSADILEIPVSQQGLDELARFIHRTYKRNASGQTIHLGPGNNHRRSMFYLAEGEYSLFNTCNTWTSEALQAAGFPIGTALQASGVVRRAQPYGRLIQARVSAAGD